MSNHISDIFRDILKHTYGLGVFDMVAIDGSEDDTALRAVNLNVPVVIKGKLKNSIAEFVDTSIGLGRMGVLDGYLKYGDFDSDDATVSIKKEERNGATCPVEIEFKSANHTNASYRFMLPEMVNEQIKPLQFKGVDKYDVVFSPTPKNIKDMSYFSSVLKSNEGTTFCPKVENGVLYFYIGNKRSDRAKIHISDNIDGNLASDKHWALDITLKILRLGNSGEATMRIFDGGMMEINVDSGLGEYTYYLPGQVMLEND